MTDIQLMRDLLMLFNPDLDISNNDVGLIHDYLFGKNDIVAIATNEPDLDGTIEYLHDMIEEIPAANIAELVHYYKKQETILSNMLRRISKEMRDERRNKDEADQ